MDRIVGIAKGEEPAVEAVTEGADTIEEAAPVEVESLEAENFGRRNGLGQGDSARYGHSKRYPNGC